ncbi:hypothetical protein [Fodinicola feengrottensis]|uniref:Uncharacterized protein n=1 Tax=Fodinicola feengrottensis TaxID=435914 RepID=A0ABN2GMX6_9ACTN|nr:hypothetical protein [Fodinicola feengrottensis]
MAVNLIKNARQGAHSADNPDMQTELRNGYQMLVRVVEIQQDAIDQLMVRVADLETQRIEVGWRDELAPAHPERTIAGTFPLRFKNRNTDRTGPVAAAGPHATLPLNRS